MSRGHPGCPGGADCTNPTHVDDALLNARRVADYASDAGRAIDALALARDPDAVARARGHCAELARRLRTLASFQLEGLEARERVQLRNVLYELANDLEDL